MRLCDALGVPLIVLVDVPGYLPGVGQEWDGVVRRGAKLLHAFGECVVPRVTLITRKTYGGAYIAMNSRALGATKVFAWQGAEVAVMGPVAAIRILHRRKLAEVSPEIRPQVEAELAAEHERIAGGVEKARRDRRGRRGRRAGAHAQRHRPRDRRRVQADGVAAGSTATSRSDDARGVTARRRPLVPRATHEEVSCAAHARRRLAAALALSAVVALEGCVPRVARRTRSTGTSVPRTALCGQAATITATSTS